ncbi:hypothetical protein P152DRAFT_423441 [Eremomyces bilateralis CBS 781.70]|uniref:DUF803-domain-containing protein n=1 Tax=Eremomyces bilateralis CBS 781.70 TaxID=1392243 RepID=A0A6G1FTQ6_9PEZI|nr:uncharacterized protein P152DRAFT_423441 [Eremomyces bilateralis CBS 781.70]KAF1809154.1 hypothetical protein P152DRAFT_423441 [Eremomyces bilateralis CBS 781.70]
MGGLSPGATIAIGVLVGLISTCAQSIGLTLQRKSHMIEDEKEHQHTRRPPYRRRRWQLGMAMFILANLIGSTIQITMLPLPVLSTLHASGLVFNTICASVMLKEPFTYYSLAGTILVAGGAGLIAYFGALSEPSHNLDQLLSLMVRPEFLVWFFGTFFVMAIVAVTIWVSNRLFNPATPRMRLFRGMCFGFLSGVLSAHGLLIAKSAVELFVRSISDRNNQFNRWQSWIILLGLLGFALLQLYCLHLGLRIVSTSVLYPFVFCIYNIVSILNGLIYFHQASRLPSLDAGLIALGTAILLSGVLALSWRLEDEHGLGKAPQGRPRITSHLTAPSAVLTPGPELLEFEDEAVSETERDRHARFSRTYAEDVESGVPVRPRTRDRPHPGHSETTPLLRTRPRHPNISTPKSLSPVTDRSLSFKNRPVRPRSLTLNVPEDAAEIWDELNDRGEDSMRRSSASMIPSRGSLRSPVSRRARRARMMGGPNRRATALGLDFGTIRTTGQRWWDRMQRPSISQDNDHLDTEGEELLVDHGRNRSWLGGDSNGNAQERGDDGLGGWFKLRWWKRRGRQIDDDGGGDAV